MRGSDTLGFEAAAALEAYEELLVEVCSGPLEPPRLASLQRQLRRICTCCLGLPQLSAPTIALMLAHHRLLAELARERPAAPDPLMQPARPRVEQCVQRLKRGCRALFVAPHLH